MLPPLSHILCYSLKVLIQNNVKENPQKSEVTMACLMPHVFLFSHCFVSQHLKPLFYFQNHSLINLDFLK